MPWPIVDMTWTSSSTSKQKQYLKRICLQKLICRFDYTFIFRILVSKNSYDTIHCTSNFASLRSHQELFGSRSKALTFHWLQRIWVAYFRKWNAHDYLVSTVLSTLRWEEILQHREWLVQNLRVLEMLYRQFSSRDMRWFDKVLHPKLVSISHRGGVVDNVQNYNPRWNSTKKNDDRDKIKGCENEKYNNSNFSFPTGPRREFWEYREGSTKL